MGQALTMLWATLDNFEAFLGQHIGRFLINDQPTIADLQYFFEFTNMIYLKLSWEESGKYPSITSWYNEMMALPHVKGIQETWAAATAGFVELLHS